MTTTIDASGSHKAGLALIDLKTWQATEVATRARGADTAESLTNLISRRRKTALIVPYPPRDAMHSCKLLAD